MAWFRDSRGTGAAGSAVLPATAVSAGGEGLLDMTAEMMHSGGNVGAGGGAKRFVSASIFRNAPRYHSGGMVGLKPDEMPIIAQKGEQILSRQQVAAMGQGQAPQHIQVINGIDHEDIVRRGLAAPSNTKVILNMVRANKAAVRQALA